ncbi:hypothetical protein MRX96_056103 [Rhipicephalus microplus]
MQRLCTEGEVAKDCVNVTESVNEHFFHTSFGMASGNDEAGVRPELLGCLAAAWIIVWAELRRRSPPSAQVLPIAMIALLTLGTAWLVGAGRGLLYLFLPRLTDIVKPVLWSRAAEQVLLALGLAHGPALVSGSYCREMRDVHRMVTIILALTIGSSLLYSIIVFSTLGSLAWETNTPVEHALHSGQGAMFVALNSYSVHWAYSGASSFSSFSSWATLLESALTHWVDTLPDMVPRKPALAMAHCAVGFMAGLPLVSRQAGLQLLHLVNAQVLGPLLAYTAFCEVAAVSWFYGTFVPSDAFFIWLLSCCESSMTSRCLVPSSLMELHQLSASDGGPAVETLHPQRAAPSPYGCF